MRKIALVACTKTKQSSRMRAQLLYNSSLYRKSLLYALTNADEIFILSAKHFLLDPEAVISPYERAMSELKKEERNEWGREVERQLLKVVKRSDELVVLCGRDYYSPLLEAIGRIGCRTIFPLQGLSLGNRLRVLAEQNDEERLQKVLVEFYKLLRDLYVGQDGGRILGSSSGRMAWPKRGVYFFLEPQEFLRTRRFSPLLQRVVRIGTHAVSKGSKTTLWDQLSTHRGGISGTGSHRSSIFRLHVGAALALRTRLGRSLLGALGRWRRRGCRRPSCRLNVRFLNI